MSDFMIVQAIDQQAAMQELARQINSAHASAENALRASLEHARNAGELLVKAKGQCKHGEWLPWLKANVRCSTRTAQAYMRVAQRWEELNAKAQGTAHLTLDDGLKLLVEAPPADENAAGEIDIHPEMMKAAAWAKEIDAARDRHKAAQIDALILTQAPDVTAPQLVAALKLLKQRENDVERLRIDGMAEMGRLLNAMEEKLGKDAVDCFRLDPQGFFAAIDHRLAEIEGQPG